MGGVALRFCIASVFWLSHSVHLKRAVRTTVRFLVADLALLLPISISTRLLSAAFYRPYLATSLWIFAFTTPFAEAWVRRVNARGARSA